MPFCREHANLLPEPHKKKLWAERPQKGEGVCGACAVGPDDQMVASEEWLNLYDLGLAILLRLDHGECGAPKEMQDPDGFCWACGIPDADKNDRIAAKVIKRFGLSK